MKFLVNVVLRVVMAVELLLMVSFVNFVHLRARVAMAIYAVLKVFVFLENSAPVQAFMIMTMVCISKVSISKIRVNPKRN